MKKRGTREHDEPTSSEEANTKWRRERVARLPKVRDEIDGLVAKIAEDVARLPALPLLVCAKRFSEFTWSKVESEADIRSEQLHAQHMVEYLQSMVAAVPRASRQRKELTEGDWDRLSERVQALFEKLTIHYLPWRNLKRASDENCLDSDGDFVELELQSFWLNVRGKRHYAHIPQYLRDLFVPHTDLLVDTFGVTGDELVEAFQKLLYGLLHGPRDAMEDLASLWRDVLAASGHESVDDGLQGVDALDAFEALIEERGWASRLESVRGRIAGAELYDVEALTGLPRELLDELSWSPGDATEFLVEGEYRGWPLRVLPVFRRPFISIGGRSYCFEVHLVFDHLYRVIQRAVSRRGKTLQERWNRSQQGLSERLTLQYLERLLPGGKSWSPAYYKGAVGTGKFGWCETDGLLAYDDHLLVLECRAGSFTYTDPTTDFPAYTASLENLVRKPAAQGQRFLDYLASAPSVRLFDRAHRPIGTIRASDFRFTTVCAVTVDPFTELAARAHHLGGIGLSVGSVPLWSVSLDDLRTMADLFRDPMVFLHFLEQRRRSFRSRLLDLNDELDHVALYFKHGRYVDLIEDWAKDADKVFLPGLRADIDSFFSRKLEDPGLRCELGVAEPAMVRQIVAFLSRSGKAGRAKVASFLLDMPERLRHDLARYVREECRRQRETRRPMPMSLPARSALTLFCWQEPWAQPHGELALEHARTVALVNDDSARLLLQLRFAGNGSLTDVAWDWVEAASIPEPARSRLISAADGLRAKRIARAQEEHGKIGRNQPCPCGSGKKWKRCCLLRPRVASRP